MNEKCVNTKSKAFSDYTPDVGFKLFYVYSCEFEQDMGLLYAESPGDKAIYFK
jgi:hypothetical protein